MKNEVDLKSSGLFVDLTNEHMLKAQFFRTVLTKTNQFHEFWLFWRNKVSFQCICNRKNTRQKINQLTAIVCSKTEKTANVGE